MFCQNYGDRVGCLGDIDDTFTMRFGEKLIHWCSFCGPDEHKVLKLLEQALETRGDRFLNKADKLISQAEQQRTFN